MAILIDETKRVLIQGITGREGATRARLMKDYGTQVVAGTTPGRGGSKVEGIPVYDTVREAVRASGEIDISVIFVPAPLVKGAAMEALDAGIKLLVLVPDRVPMYDTLEIAAAASQIGAHFIGPNTLGLLSPNRGVLGMMGGNAARARDWFMPGSVGVTSRSGGVTTSIAYYLGKQGVGCSTVVHVGGDSVVGMTHPDILRLFEQDDETNLVVMYGEIGTTQEEDAAALIESGAFTKPLVAYIGGKTAKSGTRFSHAGAIIEGGRGTYESKVTRLRSVGVHIVESFADIPRVTAEVLRDLKPRPKRESPTANRHESDSHRAAPNELRLRGYRIDELMGHVTFSQAIYLALTGNMPSEAVGKMIDAIFVSGIDQSGTIQACGEMVQKLVKAVGGEYTLDEVVATYRHATQPLPGFGHGVHTSDPRVTRLLTMADELGVAREGVAAVRALERSLMEQSSNPLSINVEGAIAAILHDIGITAELGNAFFMIARVSEMLAQLHPSEHDYDGSAPR